MLLCSDNHDAYNDAFGEAPVQDGNINWMALAFYAMETDVRQQIDAEGIEPDWSSLEESRRSPHNRVRAPGYVRAPSRVRTPVRRGR